MCVCVCIFGNIYIYIIHLSKYDYFNDVSVDLFPSLPFYFSL